MATSRIDSGLGDYLKQIKEYPLLTPEEEQELGGKIRAAAESERLVAEGRMGLMDYERLQRDAAGARDRMISANLRLVISVAKKFRNRGLPMEDLVNEGNVGLVHAVDRFDPQMGARFSTYASYWIDQAIRRAVQNATQMIHIPSYLMEQIGAMKLAMRELEARMGRSPGLDEVSRHMGISVRKARAIVLAIRACTCPNQDTADEDGSSVTLSLPDTRTPPPHDAMFSEADNDFVRNLLGSITEREATILKMRFGLAEDGRKMTLKEIGDAVGLTRERVRQIEKEAKRKLEQLMQQAV
jgi:RNA polymerase primary sigma factor